MRSRLAMFGAVTAAVLLAAGCSSAGSGGTTTAAPQTGPTGTVAGGGASDLDPSDAAFIAGLRAQGLLPPPSQTMPDAAYLADANNVCNLLSIPGESAAVIRTDMANLRKNRVSNYGITQDQAEQVMVVSVQTYCPGKLAALQAALG